MYVTWVTCNSSFLPPPPSFPPVLRIKLILLRQENILHFNEKVSENVFGWWFSNSKWWWGVLCSLCACDEYSYSNYFLLHIKIFLREKKKFPLHPNPPIMLNKRSDWLTEWLPFFLFSYHILCKTDWNWSELILQFFHTFKCNLLSFFMCSSHMAVLILCAS